MMQTPPAQCSAEKSDASFKLIIFDLDGTLLDTAAEITDSANAALTSLDLPEICLTQTREWVGNGAANFYAHALEAACQASGCAQLAPSAYDAGYAVFLREYGLRSGTNSVLYRFVKEALSHLKAQGAALCIVTNKIQAFAQQALELHGIAHFFNAVVGGDTFPEKKPNPRGVHYCMERFCVASAETLFVGDSSTDVQTARNAGVAVWALPYGYNHGVSIELSQPDRVIPDLSVFL